MKYKGNAPVVPGEYIEVDDMGDTWRRAKVRDVLAVQFTVFIDKRTRFFMYEHKGLTWRKTSE